MRKSVVFCVAIGLILSTGLSIGAESTVSDLIKKLDLEEGRLEAIDSLGLQGAKATEAVPALTALLKDESPMVRAHAARSLGNIGSAATEAVSGLVELVGDADPAVRRSAVTALRAIEAGPKVILPLLGKLMRDADDAVRNRALNELAELGGEAVSLMVESLQDEEVAYWACLVLGQIGEEAKEAVPALTALLESERPEIRREAAIALGQIGPAAAPAVPALTGLLDEEFGRIAATFALASIGPEAKSAEDAIKGNVVTKDPLLRDISRWALVKLDPDDTQLLQMTVERLAMSLTDKERLVREGAVRALDDLDPGPEMMIPAFQKAMQGVDEETAGHALDAIAAVGTPSVPGLIEALKYKSVRTKVVALLGRLGSDAAPAVGPLVELLDEEDEELRNEVIIALGNIGPGAKDAVPVLLKELEEGTPEVQHGAAYALGSIGPGAVDAKPALLGCLEGEDDMVQLVSAWAMAMIDPDCGESCKKTVPLLMEALEKPELLARLEGARALKCLGPMAKPAVEKLQSMADSDDEDQLVREMAAEALQAISGAAAAGPADFKAGSTVVTAKDDVEVKLGAEVLSRLPKGSKLVVIATRDKWVGVSIDVDGEKKSGWIRQGDLTSP